MKEINFKKTVYGNVNEVAARVTEALKTEGFGVLTRIDLDEKIKEKLNVTIPPSIILGACNPQLAYEAYRVNTDVASLLPCNAVIREIGPGSVSVELARPSFMMGMFEDEVLKKLAVEADQKLNSVLDSLH